jgi:predicted RNA-binding protein with EMAP domain
MKNYEMVAQWAATLKVEKAHSELQALKLKFPWLKCDESLAFLEQMKTDLPKITHIVRLQEKQNAIHRKYIEVNNLADKAIVEAVAAKYGL